MTHLREDTDERACPCSTSLGIRVGVTLFPGPSEPSRSGRRKTRERAGKPHHVTSTNTLFAIERSASEAATTEDVCVNQSGVDPYAFKPDADIAANEMVVIIATKTPCEPTPMMSGRELRRVATCSALAERSWRRVISPVLTAVAHQSRPYQREGRDIPKRKTVQSDRTRGAPCMTKRAGYEVEIEGIHPNSSRITKRCCCTTQSVAMILSGWETAHGDATSTHKMRRKEWGIQCRG
jgi:hypothetical protein